MADMESSQASVIAEAVISDTDSSQQSELNLHWQPVHIIGAEGTMRY